RFILLLSSHLETGHYFNPHAQRIIEAKERGARVCVIDSRLSNTASMADWWLAPWPGSESALLLAMVSVLVRERLYDREFVRRWVNWEEYVRAERPDLPVSFEAFEGALGELYARYTPEFAENETGGTAPSAWNKEVPAPPLMPPPAKVWSELLMPREYPLAFFEMSYLLPHFLKEGRGKLALYFTRVYNPVWTNPDGMSWIEVLTDP